MSANPLLSAWNTPFGLPPFAEIRPEHFRPAFDAAVAEQKANIARITGEPGEPTFANTVAAMEKSGMALDRVAAVFFGLSGADTNDDLEAIERDIAPVLARHSTGIVLDPDLFARIDGLYARRASLKLGAEEARVLERYYTMFVRAGARLDGEGKKRLAEINERLATLGTLFSQNVLADEKAYTLLLDGESDLAGLPEWLRQAAAQAAADRNLPGKHVITLSRSSIEPFLTFSTRRDLRERAFEAWAKRGENAGATDNRPLMAEMIELRAERARLLGYDSYAHYRLADTMAKTPDAALGLLNSVWKPGRLRAIEEARELQSLAVEEGNNFEIAPWDWRHYAEKMRKRRFDFDGAEIKPYLQLDQMIAAAFATAGRLFGLSFSELHDVPVYHPDVRVFEVKGADGRHVGIFIGDYFARSSKRSGAWMTSFRDQQKLTGDVRPIVLNVMNFAKPPKGEAALLSFDDARTLFHEFGHALHGLLSDVTYPFIAGTSVARDFVELPSQLFEHWLERPEILKEFAIHAKTGTPLPDTLLDKVLAARTFNQGFATVEYTSSALVDMDLHLLPSGNDVDVGAYEKGVLERIGMPKAIVMRHRSPHFQHIFSGDGYAAGYYSYLWSEVLDADAFDAFAETGDVFDPATAKRLHDFIYSAGHLRDPAEAYRAFRGRDPDPSALLKKRGLDALAGMDDAAAA
ncbi:MAG TPA: M3 family metallopeptidase [Bauldia sp.]|nr:M3 family metallopeptidase [Bauldia sp.]